MCCIQLQARDLIFIIRAAAAEKQVSFDGQKVLKARCSDKYQDMETEPVCWQQGGVSKTPPAKRGSQGKAVR